MNKDLEQAIITYSTKSHKNFSALLLGKSKDQLIALFSDLLTAYINDKNSSSIREFLLVSLAGYKHRTAKIGYNGFKQDTVLVGKTIECEAKPQNINTTDNASRKAKRRLNGGGNFTDYTNARFKKDRSNNLNILVGGFVDGELLYILSFPFKCKSFIASISRQLKTRFPKGDAVNQYLRGAHFAFKDYRSCGDLKIVFLNKEGMRENKNNIGRDLFAYLSVAK